MSRDLRKYARQTNRQLIIGGIVILFIVGDGLIFLIYGSEAAVTGIFCLLVGMIPLLAIWGILSLSGWVVKKFDE